MMTPDEIPFITITDATPQRSSVTGLSSNAQAETPGSSGPVKGASSPYRLLYRGALSLPDSYLQLDGIAFSARLASPVVLQDSPSGSLSSRPDTFARELMYNPLALALESMRGRQTLRFKGSICMQDVWIDDSGDVYMDIHPFATLTKIYFENILCLSPLVAPPHDAHGPKRTAVGVRVSLGDSDGPETTDIIIYGETNPLLHPPPLQLSPAAKSTSVETPPLSVRVARIMPAPRAPRPDDPTPRKPPVRFLDSTATLGDLGANKRILPQPNAAQNWGQFKGKGMDEAKEETLHRAREVMLHLPRSKASANRNDKTGGRNGNFKVPKLPAKVCRKQGDPRTDVFGAVEPPRRQSISGKGKGKAASADREDRKPGDAIECTNKLVVKKLVVRHLVEAGIPRSHSDFKEVFGFVYRGAAFALRSQMKTLHISAETAKTVIEAHVKMYTLTTDGAHDTSRAQESALPSSVTVDDVGG